jgi:hypothetical protein
MGVLGVEFVGVCVGECLQAVKVQRRASLSQT